MKTVFSLFLCVCIGWLSGCNSSAQTYHFDVESGPANSTLLAFAKQADVGIVFETQDIENVFTNAVEGDLEIDEAIALMTKHTPLFCSHDPVGRLVTVTSLSTGNPQ